jgi:uncharacterized membrane protein YkoI
MLRSRGTARVPRPTDTEDPDMDRTKQLLAAGALVAALAGGAGIAAATDGDDPSPLTGEALEDATAAALAHTGGGTVTETEVGDEEGAYEVEVTMADGRQVDVHLDGDLNVLGDEVDADGPDDEAGDDGEGDDAPLTGDVLARATAAALAETGGGTVAATEGGDGPEAYTVDVRRDDGTTVEVDLDADFGVLGTELDDADGPLDD